MSLHRRPCLSDERCDTMLTAGRFRWRKRLPEQFIHPQACSSYQLDFRLEVASGVANHALEHVLTPDPGSASYRASSSGREAGVLSSQS